MNPEEHKKLICGKKHAYKSLERSHRALREYIEDFPHLATGMNAYECPYCHKFHIGHTEQPVK